MNAKKVLYEELRPEEFIERINHFPVAYLPLGTLEWHGMHLPLGADGIQSMGVFKRLAGEIGGIVLPMLFLGPDCSVHKDNDVFYGMDHYSFDEASPQQLEGSAYYIEDELFHGILDTIMHNLARAGFKVVIGHGHGPSTTAFEKRKQIFEQNYGLITFNLWELGFTEDEGIQTDHAAENETSLVMALRPELTDMDRLSSHDTPIGVWGKDPRETASASLGEALIQKNIEQVSKKIQAIVSDLPKSERSIQYHAVKSLLRE